MGCDANIQIRRKNGRKISIILRFLINNQHTTTICKYTQVYHSINTLFTDI
jgi:hypothetical protein